MSAACVCVFYICRLQVVAAAAAARKGRFFRPSRVSLLRGCRLAGQQCERNKDNSIVPEASSFVGERARDWLLLGHERARVELGRPNEFHGPANGERRTANDHRPSGPRAEPTPFRFPPSFGQPSTGPLARLLNRKPVALLFERERKRAPAARVPAKCALCESHANCGESATAREQ